MFDKASVTIELGEDSPIGMRPGKNGIEILLGKMIILMPDVQARAFLKCLEATYGSQLSLPNMLATGEKSLTSHQTRDQIMADAVQKTSDKTSTKQQPRGKKPRGKKGRKKQ